MYACVYVYTSGYAIRGSPLSTYIHTYIHTLHGTENRVCYPGVKIVYKHTYMDIHIHTNRQRGCHWASKLRTHTLTHMYRYMHTCMHMTRQRGMPSGRQNCVHKYIHTWTYTCIHMSRQRGCHWHQNYTHTHTHTHMHTYVHTYMHISRQRGMPSGGQNRVHTYIHTYIHGHTHAYIWADNGTCHLGVKIMV